MSTILIILLSFIPCFVCGFISMIVAYAKLRNPVEFFLLGFVFCVIGLIICCLIPSNKEY